MILIRKAKAEDAPVIALLGRTTFRESFGHLFSDPNDLLVYFDKTFEVAKIKMSLKKESNVYWLAFYNELPVGYAKLKLNSPSAFLADEPACQLQKIYVLKDFLSKKIGHQLQSLLLEEAREKEFQTIWLSVYVENPRAIAFYERNGFKHIGFHNFQIGKEDFKFSAMAKKLNK